MSDAFYRVIRELGRPAFWSSSRPVAIGEHHNRRAGAFLIAPNHTSPYDIPLLMRHVNRHMDFVSITEVFKNRFVAWLYGNMNAFPLDRSRRDAGAVRTVLDRLERGRVVVMFPEGSFKKGRASVVYTRQMRPGIGRIALLASVPIVPAVIINSGAYARRTAWLPTMRTRYGIIFGEPIEPTGEPEEIERMLVERLVALHAELAARLGFEVADTPR